MDAAATVEHRVRWSDGTCAWLAEPVSDAGRFAQTIRGGSPIDLEFVAPPREAESVSVRLGTWARQNSATVVCRLFDPSGSMLREHTLKASEIEDGAFHLAADLRGLRLEAGRTYRCQLDSPDGSDEDGFAAFLLDGPLRRHRSEPRIAGFRNERSFRYPGRGEASKRLISALLLLGSDDPSLIKRARETVHAAFPGDDIEVSIAASPERVWDRILEFDVAFLTDGVPLYDSLCFELQCLGTCTIFLDLAGWRTNRASFIAPPDQVARWDAARRRCRFSLSTDGVLVDHAPNSSAGAAPVPQTGGLRNAVLDVRGRWMPTITVVSRSSEMRAQASSGRPLQAYPGWARLVLIGKMEGATGTPTGRDARDVEVRCFEDWRAAAAFATDGAGADDLIVLCGEGGRWAADFLAAHAFEHRDGTAAAVLGRVLGPADAVEAAPGEEACNDPLVPAGFLNCTCLNVSLPSRRTPLLDGLLEALSMDDPAARRAHELACGYDAYCAGQVFRHSRMAALTLDHEPVLLRTDGSDGAASRLRQLEGRPPSFALAARRWLRTGTADAGGQPASSRPARRGLRILSYRWHVPHQYELYKLPHRFTLATGIGENRFIDEWAFSQRPLRANVEMRPVGRIDASRYDLAILHFDEHAFAAHLSNGALNASWGDPFAHLLDLPEIPKIAICHGTPPFVGQFAACGEAITRFEVHEADRLRLVAALKRAGVRVVVNSWQALAEWGFHDARVIWHGFDPQEFQPSRYERHVLAHAEDAGRPHYRGAHEMRAVRAALGPHVGLEELRYETPPLEARATNGYAARAFAAYVDAVRRYTVYLNTTLRSPMPRSRGEAMMAGLAPICLRNHDVDRFITQGVDGFFADEPGELAEFVNHLFRVPDRARRLGEAARETALDLFNHDRFLAAWTRLIEETV